MTNPYPVAGDIIVSDFDHPFYVSDLRGLLRNRKDIPAGTPLTVTYSEDPRHGTDSHNVDFYHPDWGKRSLVIDIKKWRILGK